jgi:GNAT superfamily N-acetyltransferase
MTLKMRFRPALAEDHHALTELTIQSKASWGYEEAQIKTWLPDLTISPEYISKNEVFVLELEEKRPVIVGYYSFVEDSSGAIYLENMFLASDAIGKGNGKILMDHFFDQVRALGKQKMTLHADPHAEGFYAKMGFIVTGKLATSIPCRFLPFMEMSL